MLDDSALLRRYAAQRTEAAFAEIVRRHLDGVYSAALRRVGGDAHLAQDVAQQVFVALSQKAATVARHPLLTGWLYIATRNEAANLVRSERRRKAREQEAQFMCDNLPDGRAEADWSRVAPVLDAVIDELNETDRTAILLRYVDRRTFPDIAVVLGLSDDAARMRVDRALDKLRTHLARRGITSTAAALGLALANHAVMAAPAGLAASVTAAAAVAPAAALSAASILEFMSTTKAIAGAVTLVIIAAVGTTTREFVALRGAEATLLAARQEQAVLAAKVRGVEEQLATAENAAANLEHALEAARAARRADEDRLAKNKAAMAASGPATPEAIAAGQALLARDPELKRAVEDYCRALFRPAFTQLYQERNLTPAQIDQLERMFMMASGVLRRVAGPNGDPIVIAGPDFGNQEKRRQAELGLMWLGSDGWEQVRQSFSQNHGQTLTIQLAGALAFSSTPLTHEQAQEFSRIVVAAGGRSGTGTYPWDPIIDQARELLSEPQLAMVRGFQVQEQYQLAMREAMRRSGKP